MCREATTNSRLLAPSLRTLRSGAHTGHASTDEVLPHYCGTHKKGPSDRTAQGVYGKTDASGGTSTATTQSGRLGSFGMDGQQLRRCASTNCVCRATDAGVDLLFTPSTCRARDCPRQGVGEEEAGRLRPVTGSGRERGYRRTRLGYSTTYSTATYFLFLLVLSLLLLRSAGSWI